MTQLKMARAGKITPQMKVVAKVEGVEPSFIRDKIKDGRVVLLSNLQRWRNKSNIPQGIICGVGEGLRIKVNANIGTSSHFPSEKDELLKLKAAQEAGADTVMDLSTGGDIRHIRQALLKQSVIPFGTVPVYEAAAVGREKDKRRLIERMTAADIFRTIEGQLKDGVDFITVHCGVNRSVVKSLSEDGRVGGMVSRGGVIMAEWMRLHKQENPLYEQFDKLVEITREYDATLSLGDGLRPGALADAFDRAQVGELMVLADLARRARRADVQVMIEGPGHVPLNQIQAQVRLEKELCDGAPFYVLGPLVVDMAPGYDHITSAIGAAVAGWAGADFICYVTPMEHLGLPGEDHVREGVMAARIAAQAADITRGNAKIWQQNKSFSELRRQCNWDKQITSAIDPRRAKQYRDMRKRVAQAAAQPGNGVSGCSMCGELCAYTLNNNQGV